MVYEGDQALLYVKNFAAGSSQWEGFPIRVRNISIYQTSFKYLCLQVDVPKDRILLGAKGSTSSRFIMKLAREAVRQDLLGIVVWYCSVQNGLKYAETWDTTGREDSMAGFVEAMDLFKNA